MVSALDTQYLVGQDEVLLHHVGAVDKDVVLHVLAQTEEILDNAGVERPHKRRIINVAIETLQNLQLHSLESKEDATVKGNFCLCRGGGMYSVVIGNMVDIHERVLLEDKLTKINSLDDDEVKFLYGVIMKQTVVKFSSKGGAGLGLIDMKKKSGRPLLFHFQPITEKVAYFSLRVEIAQ